VTIEKSLKLIGAGTNKTIVDGDTDQDGTGNGRVFYIAPKNLDSFAGVTVILSEMTIQNGNANYDSRHPNPADGGGILNLGSLTVKHCYFYNNTAEYGGGICNWAGESEAEANLNVYDCTIHHHRETLGGGGIQNLAVEGRAIANVWHTVISDSITKDPGGGIQNWARNGTATVNVWYSTILDNHADDAHGGGLYNWAENNTAIAALNVYFSRIEQNTARTDSGGIGIWAELGTSIVNVWNSDICFNKVSGGAGGGINNQASGEGSNAILNVYGSRIHHNTAFGGGGIYNWGADGTARTNVWRSNIHDNEAELGSGIFNIVDSVTGKGSANLMVHNTRVHHNKANGSGAIRNFANVGMAKAKVHDSKIHDNSAEKGAGLYNQEKSGMSLTGWTAIMTVTNSMIFKNAAKKDGGGIWCNGILKVINCSIINNKADDDKEDQDTGHGGGIFYTAGKPILLGVNKIRHNTPDDIYEGDPAP
jgi:hypothetical protein